VDEKVICVDAATCGSLECPHVRPHEPYLDNKCHADFCGLIGEIVVCISLEKFINSMLDIKEGKV